MSNKNTFLQSVSFRVDQVLFRVLAVPSEVKKQGSCFAPTFVPIFLCVFVCIHVYVCMCVGGCTSTTHMCEYVHGGQRSTSVVIPQVCSPWLFLWPGARQGGQNGYQRALGIILFLILLLELQPRDTMLGFFFFKWVLGIELRSSFSQSKCFPQLFSRPSFCPNLLCQVSCSLASSDITGALTMECLHPEHGCSCLSHCPSLNQNKIPSV